MGVPAIIVPSFRRAKLMTTHRLLPDGEFYVSVPESDVPEYRNLFAEDRLIVHPDSVIGLPPKYNWLSAEFQNKEKVDCFYMDDDLTSVNRVWPQKSSNVKLSPRELVDAICNCCNMAEDVGAFLYGFNERASPLMFSDRDPFSFRGMVCSRSMGLRYGHGLIIDERLHVRGEYDISLLNAFRYRIVAKDMRFSFVNDQEMRTGGLAHYRNAERMRSSYELLRQKYGNAVCLSGGMKKGKYADDIFYNVTMSLPY